MKQWKTLLVASAFLTLALAGCSSSDDGPTETTDDPTGDLGLTADETTGIIRGVVVDESIQPVAGATITLVGTEQSTTSNDQGAFGFSALEPGEYFLKVSKLGYFDAQQSTTVVAGDLEPPVVKIQLIVDAANTPSYQELVFNGFIECSGTFGVVGVACGSVPNIVTEIACLASGGQVCAGNVTNDQFIVNYPVDRVPTYLQSEMVWDSSQALGDQMELLYSWDCGGTFLCDHGASGSSPLLLQANGTVIEEMGLGTEANPNLTVRTFNEALPETAPAGTVCVGVCYTGFGLTLEQKVQIFTHIFYGFEPEAGWRFTEDGSPEIPQ